MVTSATSAPHPMSPQREAVLTRGVDILVTAGAGTGKTYTLVERYLSLLEEGHSPRSLLAITFTNKAAREMKNRVRSEIGRRRGSGDSSATSGVDWTTLYTELDSARIGTIHSLCTEILRTHPAEARLDPRFEVLDDAQAELLRQRSVEEALAWAANDQGGAFCFTVLGEQGVREAARWALNHPAGVEDIVTDAGELLAKWGKCIEEAQVAVLERLVARPEWAGAADDLVTCEPLACQDLMAERRNTVVAALGQLGCSLEMGIAALTCLTQVKLTGGRASAWPGGAADKETVKGALETLRSLWKAAPGLVLCLDEKDEQLARLMASLRPVLVWVNDRYDQVKQQQSVLDFDDLEIGALHLLEGHRSVQDYWQRQTAAILVDEFQDTNARQRDLIALLNGTGHRLFVVGDAKQSIYRFRGADVTVFREEEERIRQGGGKVLRLDESYRAHPGLVRAVNDLLRPILGPDDPARPYVAPFSALTSVRRDASPGFEEPFVELHLAVGSKTAGALDQAADALAGTIVDYVEGKRLHVTERDGRCRPLEYADIAILCRASGSFQAYEDALERAGVPFLTVAGGGFYERPEVRDLLNALQALTDPGDDLALVGLLRSPPFGFSDVELFHLCGYRDRNKPDRTLWDVLQQHSRFGEGIKGERAVRVIGELHGRAGRVSVGDLLKSFLDATDYSAALLLSGASRAARNVAKLLADAQESGIVGPSAFLAYAAGLRSVAAREGEARSTAEGAVQIMSVHQAKGLEFPVVVIGDISRSAHLSTGPLIDPCMGLVWPIGEDAKDRPAAYKLAAIRERDYELAESARLLYVAATRSREKLLLNGCFSWDGSAAESCLGRLVTAHGWPGGLPAEYNGEGEDAVSFGLATGSTVVQCTLYEPNWTGIRRALAEEPAELPERALPPPLLDPVAGQDAVLVEGRAQSESDPPQRVWRVVPAAARPRAPAWVVGELVHRGLARWPTEGDAPDGWLQAAARECGLTDVRELKDAVRRTVVLLDRFRQSALYGEMQSAERRWHEVPYQLPAGEGAEVGILDALFLQAGRWTIVEFKTDHVRDERDLDAVLAQQGYARQARRYSRATEILLGVRPRLLICMLDVAGQVMVREISSDQA